MAAAQIHPSRTGPIAPNEVAYGSGGQQTIVDRRADLPPDSGHEEVRQIQRFLARYGDPQTATPKDASARRRCRQLAGPGPVPFCELIRRSVDPQDVLDRRSRTNKVAATPILFVLLQQFLGLRLPLQQLRCQASWRFAGGRTACPRSTSANPTAVSLYMRSSKTPLARLHLGLVRGAGRFALASRCLDSRQHSEARSRG
jgi:hypothetical protein